MFFVRLFSLVCILSAFFLSQQARLVSAQSTFDQSVYQTTGVFIFPSLTVTAWTTDEFDISREYGGGGGIGFGYGITKRFSLFANAIGGTLQREGTEDAYSLAHLDLGARATLGSESSKWKYIFDVMVSGISMENAFPKPEVELEGRIYSLGAGVQYFVKGPIALQAHVTAGAGNFNDFRLDQEEIELNTIDRAFKTSRFSLSIVWFAMQ